MVKKKNSQKAQKASIFGDEKFKWGLLPEGDGRKRLAGTTAGGEALPTWWGGGGGGNF